MSDNKNAVSVTAIWEIESLTVEFGGMLAALGIAVDNLCEDYASAESEAVFGILSGLRRLREEYVRVCESAEGRAEA